MQYYQEIAEAEREYSRRLNAICSKSAKYESSRPSGAADEPEEEKAEGQAPAPAHYLFECGDTKAAIAEFYTEMNATNTTVSRGLIDVANMITEDIFKGRCIYIILTMLTTRSCLILCNIANSFCF